jgi:hypothetical protein
MRPCILWLLALLVPTMPALGQEASPPGDPSTVRHSGWEPSPGPWRITERASVPARDGTSWELVVSERPLGTIPGDRAEIRILQPRVVVRRISGRDTTSVAVLLPTDNRALGVFPAASPEQTRVPAEMRDDGIARWPNLCRVSILDASGSLDPNGDGFPEVALRRFCSCPETSCSGIVLLTLKPPSPEILDPSSLVAGVRIGDAALVEILPGDDPAAPGFVLAPDLLEECRFVALLGIRGNNECSGCCRFPVLLRRAEGGSYEVYYDRTRQSGWLGRAKDDIAAVAAGDADRPLQSIEEAQIARAAAFFYLTGSGEQTRRTVSDGLGVRSRDFRAQDLLRRLDELFLARPAGR